MDAKTAVESLVDHYNCVGWDGAKPLVKFIKQQERYAELGRLAIADFKENMDNIRDFTDKNEANSLFIEKRSEIYKSERAELLKVEGCE